MDRLSLRCFLMAGLLCGSAALPSLAGTVYVPGIGGDLAMDVRSFQEQRYTTIFRQQYDYSCGSAALASLLTFHYDDPRSEHEIFQAMLQQGDQDKIRREGFSMLDMKRFLESQGYLADGFRMSLAGLARDVRLPLIVLVDLDGFRHFVVLKGIRDGEVLMGDPSRGLRVMSVAEFNRVWDGIAFAVRNHLPTGRAGYNQDTTWRTVARAPVGTPGQDGLSRDDSALLNWLGGLSQ